jgi:hypothetical protein
MNDLIVANSSNALAVNPALDGWADTAADHAGNPIRGSLLKCNDGQWLRGKEASPINGQHYVAMATRDVWTKWEGGKPSEYLFREPGKPMVDRKDLGDLDESQWEPGPDGQKRDKWVWTKLLYLLDERTAEALTYSTATMGGRTAIGDLADQIATMRFANPRAVPVVELGAAQMKTRFGVKLRPFLKVIDWRNLEERPAEGAPNGSAQPGNALNDAIPF